MVLLALSFNIRWPGRADEHRLPRPGEPRELPPGGFARALLAAVAAGGGDAGGMADPAAGGEARGGDWEGPG